MNWHEIVPELDPLDPFGRTPIGLRFGVLGDPVEHSLSPRMQEAAFDALGIPAEYLAISVNEVEFDPCLTNLEMCGFAGVNITVPHKQHPTLLALGDAVVKQTGAANTVRFTNEGTQVINTDPPGFYAPIQTLPHGRALVLGAGGAAAAAIFALREKGWDVAVWNRTSSKAQSLAARWMCEHRDEPDPAGCSLVVNATSLGLHQGEEPPLEWRRLEAGTTIYDLAYRQGPTDFLSHALLEGVRTVDGREMLVAQGAVSFSWWTRRNPPVEVMRKAVGL
ncbi:MAG: shikimate dehydrogenase [Armatimonadota bacterium]|nr:shikimate dehydrogenase [Armatimonadota bacterium]